MPTCNRAVACAATFLALTLAPGTADAYQCKTSFIQAESLGTPKVKARRTARTFWVTEARNKYGLAWSVWDIAASKSQKCNWTGTKFYCIVKAKPCLYVVP
ncbi:MAG: hypothetical protein AB7S92_24385 [Parvibaculaceae bacterium]